MKTYDERAKDILEKLTVAKRRRKATVTIVTSLCCCIALIAGILLIPMGPNPGNTNNSSLQLHAGWDTEDLNYDALVQTLSKLIVKSDNKNDLAIGVPEDGEAAAPEDIPTATPDDAPSYEEVTDNQVQGVAEADLIKRSNKHIFYLREETLTAYSIEGKDSKAVGSYQIGSELSDDYNVRDYETEFFLSQDCKTITVVTSCYYKPDWQRYVYLLSLDVTNPANIKVSGSCFINGGLNTSRMVGDDLYVISRLYLDSDVDYEDKSTFLPGFGTPEDMTYLPMSCIGIPENPSKAMYTVVTRLDNETLRVEDTLAQLSYTGVVYMSKKNIYLTNSFIETTTQEQPVKVSTMTEITRLSYSSFSLKNEGSFRITGRVSNQYWLDEYDNTLRVVATTETSQYITHSVGNTTSMEVRGYLENASLYCIDLSDHSIRASVEQFAPEGEDVKSVRYDADAAYVCTSIELRDPVFFFDLSNLDNIQYKDTGTIDGYSLSLVDFTDNILMGIGFGASSGTLKIEMYREGAASVESHCVFEYEDCWFSSDYKAYYIDRTNQLVGLGIYSYNWSNRYILLHFDGYELVKLLDVPLSGDCDTLRAVYIDGYLYLFGDEFRVELVP